MKKLLLVAIIFVFLFSVFYLWYWSQILPLPFFSPYEFKIKKGESFFAIAKNLKKEGIIDNYYLFLFYLFGTQKYSQLQAGKYLFYPPLTPKQLVNQIIKGETIKERLTIIEGWTLKEIATLLEEKGYSQKEFFSLVTKDFSDEFDFLKDKPKDLTLEGYLFPDTYEIEPEESLESIIKKILKNFDRKLDPEMRDEITRQQKTIFEIVIMASMLEKEVKTLEEKRLVSGILWKRLRVGMPLQVDATISYITGKKTTKISLKETQIDSPYNTYKYKGLPKGPICNPGKESIFAAIYPKESDYWYYLSTPDGEIIFSRTFKEHIRAKDKYY